VIAALAADEARARALAARAMPGERDLERGVDRSEPELQKNTWSRLCRSELDDAVGELEGERVAHLEGGRVVHRRRLPLDRLDDRLPAVPRVAAPQAREAVEDLAVVVGGVVHALGLHHHPRLRLEAAVRGERHPVGLELGGRESQLVGKDRHALPSWKGPNLTQPGKCRRSATTVSV
jgi:hypothetical protein